jgi:hypothetical protein
MLHVAYSNSVFQPCFYVALDRKNECVVIATRGRCAASEHVPGRLCCFCSAGCGGGGGGF